MTIQKATLSPADAATPLSSGAPARTPAPNPRKKLFAALGAAVVAAGAAWAAYDVLVAGHNISTDNAYVGA